MMQGLCLILKITMLAHVLPGDFFDPDELTGIQRMAQYISLFHGPYLLKARIAPAAPRLDLELYHHMDEYSNGSRG